MLLTNSLIGFAIILLASFFKIVGVKFVGQKSNPFGLFVAINFFLMSLPGIILVFSPYVDTILNVGMFSVSSSTIDYVTYSFFISLLIFIVMLLGTSYIFNGFYIPSNLESTFHQKDAARRFIVISTTLSIIFLIALFLKIGINNIPILVSFSGDITTAQILKAQLITGELSKLPETINQIFRILIPLTAYMAADQYYSNNTIRKNKIFFILSFITAFIYYSYELQKAPVFVFIFGLMFIYTYHRGLSWKIFLILPLLVVALLGVNAFYFDITDFDDLVFLVEKVSNRLFIMQNQGMYYIVEHITPSFDYLKNDAILSSYIFSEIPQRADATVMEIMYGYAESNVNMNTYFLGQAYSIAGTLGIVLGSMVIGFHLCSYLVIFKKLYKRNISFFMPLSVVFYLFFVPINQGFNSFLFGRNVIFFTVFSFIIYSLYSIIKKNTRILSNEYSNN